MKITITSLVFIFFMVIVSHGQQSYSYTQPKDLNDGWKTVNLRSEHFDSTKIYQLFNQLKEAKHKLKSILVVKNGQIILEEYFNEHAVDKQHDLRSTTKSIRSVLIGIAIDKGFIGSVDDPITKYLKNPIFSKNLDKRKEKITIRHLLTMSSGLDCNDWDQKSEGQEDKVYRKKDWIQYTLDLPMVNEPGLVSNYCSMGAVLIAEIITQASGITIDKFAEHYLFNSLGIDNVGWDHTSNKNVIPSGKRLYMTTRDMAKIGQLMLNKGIWNKQQVVSECWIEESTTPKTKITDIDYGFLWWNIPFRVNEKTITSIVATGNGGQYIMIFPSESIVAIFNGEAYNSQEEKLPFAIINNVILPTFMDLD
ncbi:serine hydrolase [Pontimicrobium sp. SW4]|uniref:Serine hydrolase n=1 Tax=Pontimicrobium sp. SW4 TaxID=3153519 RepID=A0AAU7BP31_9FLAO